MKFQILVTFIILSFLLAGFFSSACFASGVREDALNAIAVNDDSTAKDKSPATVKAVKESASNGEPVKSLQEFSFSIGRMTAAGEGKVTETKYPLSDFGNFTLFNFESRKQKNPESTLYYVYGFQYGYVTKAMPAPSGSDLGKSSLHTGLIEFGWLNKISILSAGLLLGIHNQLINSESDIMRSFKQSFYAEGRIEASYPVKQNFYIIGQASFRKSFTGEIELPANQLAFGVKSCW